MLRFIALKVPLNAELLKLVPPEEKWGVNDVINVQHLGHVIDLTNTNRYAVEFNLWGNIHALK